MLDKIPHGGTPIFINRCIEKADKAKQECEPLLAHRYNSKVLVNCDFAYYPDAHFNRREKHGYAIIATIPAEGTIEAAVIKELTKIGFKKVRDLQFTAQQIK